MKLRSPRLWIAVLSTGAVLLVAGLVVERKSPGPLTEVHGREPDLVGRGSCAQCHGGWFESMAEACLGCHERIGHQMERGVGLHGVIDQEKAARCALCHSDHNGPDFKVVNPQSFAAAGVPDVEKFDHTMVGFAMAGKHLELGCEKCHEHAHAPILAEGQTRFIGLQQDCANCHEDSHEGRMQIACASCHGQTKFDQLESLDHDRHLPLVGGHGDVSCRICHTEKTDYSLENVGGEDPPPVRDCAACHISPHAEDFIKVESARVSKTPGTGCVTCHAAEHTAWNDERLKVTPEQHASSGFALAAPHHEVECAGCHGEGADFAARYPGRVADDCVACHQDPHEAQFGERKCIECHDRAHFEPHTFTTELHAKTELPLTGRHLDTECSECHTVPEPERARVFAATPSRCDACHKDVHGGFFPAENEAETCGRCHDTKKFATVADFDHGHWTGFDVVGAHAASDCESCHPRSEKPDELGRTLGRVADHFGEYTGCATCHADPHEGAFDKKPFPTVVDGKRDCARCHVETSFRVFEKEFDHGRWTAFPIEGAHAEAGCVACHAPLRKPELNGRTWTRANGSACADCHADPHAGQFRVEGVTDCLRCHTSATAFQEITFRHNLDSRFVLGKQHENATCEQCHPIVRHQNKNVVRYRPLKRLCADCHNAQRNPLRRKGK